jgi:hypothetical protein
MPELDELTSQEPEPESFENKWSPTIDATCPVKGCDGKQYGESGVCFKHLLRQVGCW